jgi:hypothetical protein
VVRVEVWGFTVPSSGGGSGSAAKGREALKVAGAAALQAAMRLVSSDHKTGRPLHAPGPPLPDQPAQQPV